MAEPKRFAILSDNEIDRILTSRLSTNTKKSTVYSVQILREFLKAKNAPVNFEVLNKQDLDLCLADFFLSVRRHDGELYKRTSFLNIRHGINRFLKDLNHDIPIDIIKDPEFMRSNMNFAAMLVELKRQGKANVKHWPPIPANELKKAYIYLVGLMEKSARGLQQKVFIDVMLHFGRRGRENLHELLIDSFVLERDSESGLIYIKMHRDELTKNHRENDETSAEGRMYQILGK